MSLSEQRIKAIEDNMHELETRTNKGAHNLEHLTLPIG